jgi:hypothetical protein
LLTEFSSEALAITVTEGLIPFDAILIKTFATSLGKVVIIVVALSIPALMRTSSSEASPFINLIFFLSLRES